MAESIGDFFVNFFFKTDKASADAADKTLKTLKTKYEGLTDSAFRFNEITSAFRTAIAPVRALAHSILDVGDQADRMNDFAMSVGASVESLQRMQYVGEMTGTSIEGLNQGTKTLARELHAAAEGKDEAVKTFKQLGVAFKDSSGHMREVGQVMPDVIAKIASLPTDGQKAQAAMNAFGKAGLELLPMMKKSKEELAALGKEFDALGGGFNEEFVATAAQFGDNMDRSRQILSNMRREIAASVLPTINRLLEKFTSWGKSNWPEIKEALNSFGSLLSKIFQNTAADAIDTFLKLTHQLFNDKEKWEQLVGVIEKIGIAFAAWVILKHPAVAAVMAFTAAMVDLLGMMEGKDSLIGRASLGFRDWVNSFIDGHKWLKGIVDYLKVIKDLFDSPAGSKGLLGAFKKAGTWIADVNQSTAGALVDPYVRDGANQQLDINKRKVLEGMDPLRANAARKLGLMKAGTAAEVQRIANQANNIVINVQGSPGMDPRDLAHKIKKEFDKQVAMMMSDAHDSLVTEGP